MFRTVLGSAFAAGVAADTCSLYEIADGSCGQSDMSCSYVKYAKAAEKGLVDGTCADQGYTVQTGTQTKSYPVIGDIVITTFDEPSLNAAADTCSLYEIADGSCGQSDMSCSYVKYAKAAEKGLVDGTCADQGYTVQTGTQTKHYPVIGDIVITTFDEPSLNAAADTCSLYEIADGSCGQSDMSCSYVKYAKAAEKGLVDGTCADQGYTEQTGTQTKHYPVIGDIVITTFDQPTLGDNMCSANIGKCGRAYQACCIGYGATGYPCGCSLSDGEGSSKGDCGTCGAAYQICCDGFKADGFACGCDVTDGGFLA